MIFPVALSQRSFEKADYRLVVSVVICDTSRPRWQPQKSANLATPSIPDTATGRTAIHTSHPFPY